MANLTTSTSAWEDGRLGRSMAHTSVADESHEIALDKALGLQTTIMHIRVPTALFQQYASMAKSNGVTLETLIGDVLTRAAK